MRNPPLRWALGAVVVLGALATSAVAPGAAAQGAPAVSVDVRVWQNDEDELDIRVGARAGGDPWQNVAIIPLPLDDGLSGGGWYRYGDIELEIAVPPRTLPAIVEVRVWQEVGRPRNVYVSARGSLGSWLTLGTVPLALDEGPGRYGVFRYSDVRLDVPLPQAAVTTFAATVGIEGALTIAPDGSVLAANPRSSTVERFSPEGRLIATFGQGARGEPRDGPAGEAGFREPRAVAAGPDGAIYVGDRTVIDWLAVGLVRRIAPDGTVSTLAGGMRDASWGDFLAPAAELRFGRPSGLAVDGDGGIFVLEYSALLHLSLDGGVEVRVVAGRPATGATGVTDGPGREALFGQVVDGAVDVDDAGNVYVLDPMRWSKAGGWVSRTAVRMIDRRGVVSTLFQDPHPSFGGVLTTSRGGLAVTGDGSSVYIANTAQNQIVRLTREGELQAVAGTGEPGRVDGACDEALFDRPGALALTDDDRTLLVADQGGAYIRRIDLARSAPCVGRLPLAEPEAPPPKLAGVESRVVARFPSRISLREPFVPGPDNVLVGVVDGSLSQIVLGRGRHPTIVPIIGGTGAQDGACEAAQLNDPGARVAVEGDGSIWFVDSPPSGGYSVRRITWTVPSERVVGLDCQVTTIATLPRSGGRGVALDGQGNLLFANGGLHRISPDGTVSTLFRGDIRALAFAAGSAYVIQSEGEGTAVAIRRIDADGRTSVIWAGPEARHGGGVLSLGSIELAAAPDGTLYAWSDPDERILRIDPDGAASIVYDATDDLGGPDVYIDGHPYIGAGGHLWVNAWNAATDSTEIHQFTFPGDPDAAPTVSE